MVTVSAADADAALAAAHAGSVDDAPIIGWKAANAALKRWEATHADVSGAFGVWLRELNGDVAGNSAREPSRRQQLAHMTYSDLVAADNRELFDRVVRAVAAECDLDYLEALEQLQDWHNGGDETLGHLLSHLDVGVILGDVIKMEERETPAPALEVEMLDSSDPERQVSAEMADEYGRIPLPDGADRAHLLTDAYTLERAWLKARDLEPRFTTDDIGGRSGRQYFEAEYRDQIEQGFDLIGTLEAQHAADHAEDLSPQQLADVAAADRQAPAERRRRAAQRQLEDEIAERQERLGRL